MAPRRRLVRFAELALPLVAVWAVVTVPTALWMFDNDQRTVVIGAHTTTVSPTFDEYATLDFGPLLPRMRIPVDQPFGLGVSIDVGDTDVNDVNELIARDAVIASQPEGEIQRVRNHVVGMAVDSTRRAAGVGIAVTLMVAVGWHITGRERRALVRTKLRSVRTLSRKEVVVVGASVATFGVAVALIVVPTGPEPRAAASSGWRPLPDVVPGLEDLEGLQSLEISTGSATEGGVALVESATETYRASQEFYGKMLDRVPKVTDDLRKPEEGQTAAMLVSDRHNNIGMDPVVAAVARAAQAELLIDAGDDTSTGGEWEEFSINSLERAFDGFEKVGIAGNHDTGTFVTEALSKAGFEVLHGEPVDVGGIRFLGGSDPRSSGLTAGYADGSGSIVEQGERLRDVACEDGDVSTVVVHSPTTTESIADSGCADLILSGHLHRQVGPDTVAGENGVTTTFSNGTTGGAAYAFALGSKLRRPAQATLVTYEDGRPVGLQPVNFQTSGAIDVADYTPIANGDGEDTDGNDGAGEDGNQDGDAGDTGNDGPGNGGQDDGGSPQGG